MGRENGDTAMISSSIALLQERFRKLERMKEKRQERELLKLFSESERVINPSPSPILGAHSEPSNFTFQYPDQTILPYRQSPSNQDCLLSLGLNNSQGKHSELLTMKDTPSTLWLNATGSSSSSSSTSSRTYFDNSDVDTSLHL